MQRSKQVWKEREQIEIEEENRRIWKYLKEQESRNEEAKAIASEKLKHSYAVAERMCAELEDIEVSFIVAKMVSVTRTSLGRFFVDRFPKIS